MPVSSARFGLANRPSEIRHGRRQCPTSENEFRTLLNQIRKVLKELEAAQHALSGEAGWPRGGPHPKIPCRNQRCEPVA